MKDTPRLIERAFPLKQASLDSVHEKNVRHGHISTLHIWPARRPLAACRAALLATLLPDPGSPEERRKLCERIGGKVVQKVVKKKMPSGKTVERIKEETEGGVLSWIGTAPKSGSNKKKEEHQLAVEFRERELNWFRQEIKKAYGGRAPRVLDPFAGGGAIPLEASRLGCDSTYLDINPVAWFIGKCTLEYSSLTSGQSRPLPDFAIDDEEFIAEFKRVHGISKRSKGAGGIEPRELPGLFAEDCNSERYSATLAWHVRAWGRWVHREARRNVASCYPTYAEFEPLEKSYQGRDSDPEMRLVHPRDDGTPDLDALNADFSPEYLAAKRNPRWVPKPPIAYLWARTVVCKNCRVAVPLLKTLWLCKKDKKRVLLAITLSNDKSSYTFSILNDVPVVGGNTAQRREHDKRIGAGTMSKSGAMCPCCGTISTMNDIRVVGRSGALGTVATVVVVEGQRGKEYRLPTAHEQALHTSITTRVRDAYDEVPLGLPVEKINTGSIRKGGVSITRWGIDAWCQVFTPRQLLAIRELLLATRSAAEQCAGYSDLWREAILSYLTAILDRTINYCSTICIWEQGLEQVKQTFLRFALPITWDFAEANPFLEAKKYYLGAVEASFSVLDGTCLTIGDAPKPTVTCGSVLNLGAESKKFDVIMTDPPYYDAIPYADLMDFFYVWLRRTLRGIHPAADSVFADVATPKWDHSTSDGELIDDESRFEGDSNKSRVAYEDGMHRAFVSCSQVLNDDGRLVVVFANKNPVAWEALVAALIRGGFVVTGSWPIMTEMRGGIRNLGRASLASSVWLVCRKRPLTARPGWDNRVLDDMRDNIAERLREYWDAGIRGPDFVWAATGPALEAYSEHPIVKKANDPGEVMTVTEFLSRVRRMVVDFVVGQVLTGQREGVDLAAADRMDAPTAYYLLHRHDFGLEEAPAGACILYSTACGISDRDLEATWNLISHKGGRSSTAGDEEEVDPDAQVGPDADSDSSSKIALKTWAQRKSKSIGYEAPGGNPIPLIDRVHRLMHLWKAGDLHKVDEYLDDNGLRRQELFKRLVQSLIELSPEGSEERKLLESLSNHVRAKGATPEERQAKLALETQG